MLPRELEFPLLGIHFFDVGFLISSYAAESEGINPNPLLISRCEPANQRRFEEGEREAERLRVAGGHLRLRRGGGPCLLCLLLYPQGWARLGGQ